MAKKVDTTSGNLVKIIFAYTIPIIISSILQNLFNIVDKAVLGNMAGSVAVAAVGATSTVINLVINGAVGLSAGVSIILARYIGQKDFEKTRQTVSTALITAVLIGAIVAAVSFVLAPYFMTVMNCPAECYNGAVIYMRIYLSAAPFTLLFNFGSAVLRSFGDTRKPLVYVTVAGIVNVVLNVILCLVLPEKVMAVAIATAVSKIICAVLVVRRILKFDDNLGLKLTDLRFNIHSFLKILRFGIPSSISILMYPLANLQITAAINSFGVDAVAGSSGAESIHTIVAAFAGGFGTATTTMLGQNIGARKPERVKRAFWYMLGFGVLIAGSLGVTVYFSGRLWLRVIIGSSSAVAIDYGMKRLFFVTFFAAIQAANSVLSHAFQAFGYPLFTTASDIAFTLVFRVAWMQFVYPQSSTFDTMMFCFTTSWVLNLMFYAVAFTFIFTRYLKKGICKKI